ncbi:hypothetical protein FCX94_17295, partial [Escherichia coli]|nr:hypothetical protein [Escherichia coli]MDN0521668.1 hypothetical protein [Escherichia coli]MDN0573205.1 hypothetical protein [Escherichia coli]MDN1959262.1 hypothetical protein [Escherichia coli]
KTAPDGAVSGMPAIRETGPGKNLQAITVSTKSEPLDGSGVYATSSTSISLSVCRQTHML